MRVSVYGSMLMWADACGGQKRASSPQKLEFQTVRAAWCGVLGTEVGSSARAMHAFNCSATLLDHACPPVLFSLCFCFCIYVRHYILILFIPLCMYRAGWVYMRVGWTCAHCGRGQLVWVSSLFLPCRTQNVSSSHQAWQPSPLPTELACCPVYIFKITLAL